MKKIQLLAWVCAAVLLCTKKDSSAQAILHDWKKYLPLYSPAEASYARVAVDTAGNAFWAVNCKDSATHLNYIWLLKYDASGSPKWSSYYDATYGASFTDLACDIHGNIYLLGTAQKAAPDGSNAAFVRKYEQQGTLSWSLLLDTSPDGEEKPDQIRISPVDQNIIVTHDVSNTMFVSRYDPNGNLIWQQQFLNYQCGDIYLDHSNRIHLVATYLLNPEIEGQRWCYLLLDDQGNFVNSFTQAGGTYSHAIKTGGVGRTIGGDKAGNIYALGWVKNFPFNNDTWTNIMVYKFNALGNQEWSYRLKRVRKGSPDQISKLIVDPTSGETLVAGGAGCWKYAPSGAFITGWYDILRQVYDLAQISQDKTFMLSSTDFFNNDDNGKISLLDWTKNDSIYTKGRSDIQFLNATALIEPDPQRWALFVTWCYNGKAELHRLILDTLVSVGHSASWQSATVYPNPTTGCLTINAGVKSDQPLRMEVFNSIGRLVWHTFVTHEQFTTCDLRFLPSGIYTIVLSNFSHRLRARIQIFGSTE
ncbi:MAG: T9SS type A sorting domain-containing protein [Chitinophagales bacterium]|nr:T9SS type A sorting domain-containing protein [Chitinophagales bacterium]MDW8427344.1 T9SS type A sorting domain-containing protein [Chitinophagales bacterium]